MKVLSPFLAGFSLPMAMHATTDNEIATWITLFVIALIGTIAFTCLEKL